MGHENDYIIIESETGETKRDKVLVNEPNKGKGRKHNATNHKATQRGTKRKTIPQPCRTERDRLARQLKGRAWNIIPQDTDDTEELCLWSISTEKEEHARSRPQGAHLRIVNPHTSEQRAQCSKNLAKQHRKRARQGPAKGEHAVN